MPGIIAESHFDGGACARVRNVRVAARAATPPPRARRAISPLAGRNFIFMTRGRKRYIISRPSECSKLAMLMSGPSARHSGVDWTTPEGIATLSNASALEVVSKAVQEKKDLLPTEDAKTALLRALDKCIKPDDAVFKLM